MTFKDFCEKNEEDADPLRRKTGSSTCDELPVVAQEMGQDTRKKEGGLCTFSEVAGLEAKRHSVSHAVSPSPSSLRSLIYKYHDTLKNPKASVCRTVPALGKVFVEFFTDLERVMPGFKEFTGEMKDLAASLYTAPSKQLEKGHKSVGTESKHLETHNQAVLRRLLEPPKRDGLRILGDKLIKLNNQPCIFAKKKQSIDTGYYQVLKASSKGEGEEVSNKIPCHRKVGSVNIPKLNTVKAKVLSQDFNDEFLSKLGEFSESWRLEVAAMKTKKYDIE